MGHLRFKISKELLDNGVKSIDKEGDALVILYKDIVITVLIKSSCLGTAKECENACKPHLLNRTLVQAIIKCVVDNWHLCVQENDNDKENIRPERNQVSYEQKVSRDSSFALLIHD